VRVLSPNVTSVTERTSGTRYQNARKERVCIPAQPFSRRHLLLVENDKMVRDTVVSPPRNNCQSTTPPSAATALSVIRARDLALTDVMLLDRLPPGGNPAAVLAQADQRSRPGVAISGDPRQAGTMAPVRRFLPKPLSRATLLTIPDNTRG
jgi:hypothetical protein